MTTVGGSINEAGYVAGMNKKGFNGPRALGELSANPIDAKATSITYDITKDKVSIIDNGSGMVKGQLMNMWDAQRQNHLHETSTGVSGFGAKPSTKILSKDNIVIVYTKSDKDAYYKAVIPWNKIVYQGKYTGMIEISEMNSIEVKYFKSRLSKTGTIVQFSRNPFIENTIMKQFNNFKSIKESNQRLNCVFSKFTHVSFQCLHYEKTGPIPLEMYAYLNGPSNDYYVRNHYDINIFLDSSNNHIYARSNGNSYLSFQKNGRGWSLNDWIGHRCSKKIGTIEVICGLRKDDNYFDYKNPTLPGASKKLHSYENKFFEENDDEIKADLWYPSLYRNDQYIGNINSLPKLKPATARADGLSCLKCSLIRTNISYEVNSSQDNDMDELMGIQENKNQLNTHHIDESLRRLVEDCMKHTSDEIWSHFEKAVEDEHKRKEQEKKEQERLLKAKLAAKAAADLKKARQAATEAKADALALVIANKWMNLVKKVNPKVNSANKDQPKEEQPKEEQPKNEQPKKEQPKKEQPKKEQPKKEQPKKEPKEIKTVKITPPEVEEKISDFTFRGTRQQYIEHLKNTFLTPDEKKHICPV